MRIKFVEMLRSLLQTIILLIVLEITSTSLIPALGIFPYKVAFNILLILYLGFRLESPYLPLIVLAIQVVHGAFTIEGWAYGTVAGVLICMLIGRLKDFLHLNSTLLTVLIIQFFQLLWLGIVSFLIYLKTSNTQYIINNIWSFLPSSLVLSVFAPYFFQLMHKIWKNDPSACEGDL